MLTLLVRETTLFAVRARFPHNCPFCCRQSRTHVPSDVPLTFLPQLLPRSWADEHACCYLVCEPILLFSESFLKLSRTCPFRFRRSGANPLHESLSPPQQGSIGSGWVCATVHRFFLGDIPTSETFRSLSRVRV